MSLRWRFALGLAALAAAAAIAAFTASYVSTSRQLHSEIDRDVEVRARFLIDAPTRFGQFPGGGLFPGQAVASAPDPERSVVPSPVESPDAPPFARSGFSDVLLVQILDASGRVTTRSGQTRLPVDAADLRVALSGGTIGPRTIVADNVPYRVETAARKGGGAVQIARNATEAQHVLDDLGTRFVLLALVIIAAAAALGWFLAARATRSLVELAGAAEQVATTGRLDVPIGVEGTDEPGRLAGAFNRMLAALAASREQQQQLVQDAEHELRTPLTSISTNLAVLRRHDELQPEMKARILGDLEGEVGELVGLVDELVDLAADRYDEEPEGDVQLDRIVEHAAARARRRTGREIEVDAEPTVVTGRSRALSRAVGNLLDNALKFDASATPIEVGVHAGRVEVRDHGPGIAPAHLPHVFERFSRAPDARSRPGSGLGLSIVADTVEAHGGQVFASNATGGGAVVGFQLPVRS